MAEGTGWETISPIDAVAPTVEQLDGRPIDRHPQHPPAPPSSPLPRSQLIDPRLFFISEPDHLGARERPAHPLSRLNGREGAQ